MKSQGISGFSIIFIIIVIIFIGYTGYHIARVHFTYGSLNEKVENTVRIGSVQSDEMIRDELIKAALEAKVMLSPEQIWIDHSISDSFRIYIEYDDSSSIFGVYTYSRHFVIDKVAPIEINY